jgi:hypothetical protein
MSGVNANTPRGLVPYAYTWGAPFANAVSVFYVPATDDNNLFVGDPVVFTQTTADANGVPGITIGEAGDHAITGVFLGVANNAGELVIPVLQSQPVYKPALQAAYVYVGWDPNLLYWIQDDGGGGPLANTSGGGQLADLVAGAGSTYTGFSGWQLDGTTVGSGHQLSIIQALQEIDNYVGAIHAKWLVRIVDRLPVY